ncbi:hypothetical protein Tcan_01965 [Toxocara canis]|uniref:Uncharacterized protein n=1 Tax=Toxocara canis TaxID=6265 RepID=A0A0B2VVS6_TOXCA|nr:hypothetical protein Tcan_01965 [Toxocara canis]
MNLNTYDPELGDSDDSFDSVRRSRTLKNEDAIQQLKETHAERGAREPHHFTGSSLFNSPPSTSNEQSSLNGAGEMLCTASGSTLPIHSAVASFQPFNNNDDVDEVKNFRINEQLKETHAERGAREPHHFTGSSLFNSPPSTSNEQSSLNGAGEMLCTASGSTLPIHSAVASFQPFNNNDDVDEVKNFRINEVREMHSTLEIARCSKIDSSSSMSQNHENTLDPTVLEDDTSTTGTVESAATMAGDEVRRKRGKTYLRRSLSDTDTLEMKVETLLYRLRKEEDKKNSYKQKLMSERIVRQHVEAKFVEDIQRLTRLVETLKNEQKTYRNKIGMLETQLKETHAERGAREPHHFTGSSLFNSPPSTSNEQSSLNGAGEMLCTASGSTLPIHSAVASFQPFNNNDDVDEVKNFRINEVREMHSTLEIARCSKIDSSSSMSQNHENTLDPTVLEDDTSTTGTVESAATMAGDEVRRKRGKTYLRRSLSDTDVRAFRVRGSRTQMTNL